MAFHAVLCPAPAKVVLLRLLLEEHRYHVALAHLSKGFAHGSKFHVIIRCGSGGAKQTIGDGAEELGYFRPSFASHCLDATGFIANDCNKIIGFEVVELLVVCDS